MQNKIFSTPEKLTYANVDQFIKMAYPIFDYQNKRLPNVIFDTTTTKKLDLLGSLLIYKFHEYTVHKKCFAKPTSKIEGYVKEELEKRLIKSLVDTFIRYKSPEYNKLRFIGTDNLFISPILLNRESKEDELANAGKDISNYYQKSEDIRFIVLTCMAEIASNFKAHADEDTESILSVTGTKDSFEIACVDTGVGIITSLSSTFRNKGTKCPTSKILEKALDRGVSSKNIESGHMGYGLWMLKELVLAAKGEFRIYSEGFCVICHNGRIKFKSSHYWKGTIAYMKLPLSNAKKLKKNLRQTSSQNNIKIRKS